MEHVKVKKIDEIYSRYTANNGYAIKMNDETVLRSQVEIKTSEEWRIEVVKL